MIGNQYWKFGAAVVFLQVLSGCATLTYQEPLDGARAKVRFATTGKEATVLRAYADESCEKNEQEWMRLRDGPMMNNPPKSLGLPLNGFSVNAAKEVYVEAGKQINMLFVGVEAANGRVYSCGTPLHFTFAENKAYEVKYNWDPVNCSIIVSEIANQSGQWALVKVATFTNQVNEKNKGCVAQFKKNRPY